MITSIEKANGLIGNRTRDLPAYSIMPRPTTLLRKMQNDLEYLFGIYELQWARGSVVG
jgi:hypothetical protein